jgi:hypothetical protein
MSPKSTYCAKPPVGEGDTPGAATNGHRPAVERAVPPPFPPPVVHPSAEDIERLGAIAIAAAEDKSVFGDRLRRLMQLGPEVKLTKKFLRETMTVEQFQTVMTYYENLLRQVLRPNVTTTEVKTDGAPISSAQTSLSESEPASTGESPAAVPTVQDSAGSASPDATERTAAYHKLFQEALGWGVAETEIRYILDRHDLAKSRVWLWKARRNTPAPTWVPVAAD